MNDTSLRRRRKEQILDAMGGACWECGESRYPCLSLHHRWPELKTTSHNTENGALWRRKITVATWAEVWSCRLLCFNCHAWEHHSETVQRHHSAQGAIPE